MSAKLNPRDSKDRLSAKLKFSHYMVVLKLTDSRAQNNYTGPIQPKVKEALHIERTLANTRLSRDGGYDLLGCWITTVNKLGGGPTTPPLIALAQALRPLH